MKPIAWTDQVTLDLMYKSFQKGGAMFRDKLEPNLIVPLYLKPQYRELSDEEIWKIYNITGLGNGMAVRFARAILKKARGE